MGAGAVGEGVSIGEDDQVARDAVGESEGRGDAEWVSEGEGEVELVSASLKDAKVVRDGEGEALCEADWEGEVVGDDPKEGVLSMVPDALALSERKALADWVACTVGEGLNTEVEVRVANKEAV